MENDKHKIVFEILNIINNHFCDDDFNQLVRSFVEHKTLESTVWSELTLYIYCMFGGSSPHIFHSAAQTELIILSLDIFDDLQDQDNFAPPWMKCDLATAMNCASNLLVAGIAGNSGMSLDPKILKLLSSAHNGQHKDIQNTVTHEEAYIAMVSEKSAALINIAILIGYQLLENKDPSIEERLAEFAQHIGITAQLQNDVTALTLLKSRNDIIQRKRTLATMYLLEQCETTFPLLKEYYDGQCEIHAIIDQKPQFMDFIQSSGVIEYTSLIQTLHLNQAEQILESLPTLTPWDIRFKEMTIDQ